MKKTESTGKYISYLARLLQSYSTNQFNKYDLSSIEYAYIMILKDNETMSQKQLSKEAFVDKAQTTRAINSLLNKGLVIKDQCKEDRRLYHISLSQKGLELAPEIRCEIENFEMKLNKGLTKEEQRQMKSLLIRMIRNMKEKW